MSENLGKRSHEKSIGENNHEEELKNSPEKKVKQETSSIINKTIEFLFSKTNLIPWDPNKKAKLNF